MKIFQFALFTLAAFAVAARSDAALFASSAAGAAGRLYTINPANGALVQDIGPLNDVAGANYSITGLAFHPTTGVLYGSTGNANTAAQGTLVTINPATAVVTVVGPFNAGPVSGGGNPATMADLSFDSAGNLFGVGSVGGPDLYSVNPATGQATLIGANGVSTSTSGGGLAISSAGVFYGTPSSSRYGAYDAGSGAFTNIANPAKPAGTGAYTALDYNGSVLYGLNTGPGSPPPTHLVTIESSTGVVTDLGASLESLDAIAFQIPEPTTAAFAAGAALLGVIGARRRK